MLKIDRAFLAESNSNKRANDILGYVIRMAGSLGMHTICEGIETDEQAELADAVAVTKGFELWKIDKDNIVQSLNAAIELHKKQ